MMNHSIHTTLITGSIVRTELWASSREEAMARQIAKYPPGFVLSISAWPIRETRACVNLSARPVAATDSAFGTLV